jgi:hypothetical protein
MCQCAIAFLLTQVCLTEESLTRLGWYNAPADKVSRPCHGTDRGSQTLPPPDSDLQISARVLSQSPQTKPRRARPISIAARTCRGATQRVHSRIMAGSDKMQMQSGEGLTNNYGRLQRRFPAKSEHEKMQRSRRNQQSHIGLRAQATRGLRPRGKCFRPAITIGVLALPYGLPVPTLK